ncbi:MAG: sugar transferase [Gemmatimonadaceae bacterium]|nr:sugar transferase [Gemmatimonadaceae bacterium]
MGHGSAWLVPVVNERTFYAHLFERLLIDVVSKRWIVEQGLARPHGVVVATKRLTDLVLSVLCLIELLPVMAVIALSVKLSSSGPVFFMQTRQGRFFKPFRMSKFRTMRHDHDDGDPGGFTRLGDGRVTPVGRLMRRAHLDEPPQLIKILRGGMSLVGPRPETLDFARRNGPTAQTGPPHRQDIGGHPDSAPDHDSNHQDQVHR